MEATGQGFDAGSCRGKDAAEQIDDDACAIAGAAVRLEDRWKPAGLDRGGGQRPLSFEGPLQLSPLLRGKVRVYSVGDRDERNPVGDREQRQTEPVSGGRRLRGSRLVRQVGPEPDRQGCDPAVTSPSIEEMYRDDRTTHGLPAATPWDIGGPQPVVQRLVALGAIKGEVLDPGTGPGHHAIHYASKGLSATGIDASPTAIERAKQNAGQRQRVQHARLHTGGELSRVVARGRLEHHLFWADDLAGVSLRGSRRAGSLAACEPLIDLSLVRAC